MLKLKKFVSNKNIIIYVFVYGILRSLFLITPLISRNFIDSAVDKNISNMKLFALISVLLFVLTQIVMYIFDIIEKKINVETISDIYRKIDSNLEFYNIKTDSISRDRINQEITYNLGLIESFIFEIPIKIIFSIITIIVIFFIMFNLSIFLSLIMIVVIPSGAYISYKLGHMISNYSEENIVNTRDIKGFMLDKYEITKSERLLDKKQLLNIRMLLDKYKNTLNKKYKLESLVNNLLIYFILNGVILSMVLLSGYFVLKGTITIGTFFATQLYVSQFWTPVEYLFGIRNEYLTAKPAINSFIDFMDVELINFNNTIIKNIFLEDIQSLSNKNISLHEEISMNFNNNYINIISGENGTGKTTIIEAIMNYTDRYNGKIFINDKLLDKLSYSDIVYIPANYIISNYGILSDKVNFSSGQKKKAQIKLSISTNKNVYIIDEPTNFLDKENKLIIVDIINKLYRDNKIIILITHDDEIINKLINPKIYYLERIV